MKTHAYSGARDCRCGLAVDWLFDVADLPPEEPIAYEPQGSLAWAACSGRHHSGQRSGLGVSSNPEGPTIKLGG